MKAVESKAAQEKESELVITRVFDAPRESVWKAWTDPQQMKRWWGPKDFTAPFVEIDFRVGGKYLSCMRGPDGKEYWSTGAYREIVAPEHLVVTDSFSDSKGNPVPASDYGMTGYWPDELTVIVDLEDNTGKTTMTLRHIGLPPGEMLEMCKAGWNESFDKLEKIVK